MREHIRASGRCKNRWWQEPWFVASLTTCVGLVLLSVLCQRKVSASNQLCVKPGFFLTNINLLSLRVNLPGLGRSSHSFVSSLTTWAGQIYLPYNRKCCFHCSWVLFLERATYDLVFYILHFSKFLIKNFTTIKLNVFIHLTERCASPQPLSQGEGL